MQKTKSYKSKSRMKLFWAMLSLGTIFLVIAIFIVSPDQLPKNWFFLGACLGFIIGITYQAIFQEIEYERLHRAGGTYFIAKRAALNYLMTLLPTKLRDLAIERIEEEADLPQIYDAEEYEEYILKKYDEGYTIDQILREIEMDKESGLIEDK